MRNIYLHLVPPGTRFFVFFSPGQIARLDRWPPWNEKFTAHFVFCEYPSSLYIEHTSSISCSITWWIWDKSNVQSYTHTHTRTLKNCYRARHRSWIKTLFICTDTPTIQPETPQTPHVWFWEPCLCPHMSLKPTAQILRRYLFVQLIARSSWSCGVNTTAVHY